MSRFYFFNDKVERNAKIRNRNNQVPHLTQETIFESYKNTLSSKGNTQKSQVVSPFPAGDHKPSQQPNSGRHRPDMFCTAAQYGLPTEAPGGCATRQLVGLYSKKQWAAVWPLIQLLSDRCLFL